MKRCHYPIWWFMNLINEFILDNTSICHILFGQDEDFTFWHMVIPNTSTICAEWNSGNLSCSLKFLNYPTNLSDFSNLVLHDTFLKFHPTTSIGGSFLSDIWMPNFFSVFKQQILNFKKIKQCGLEFSRFSRSVHQNFQNYEHLISQLDDYYGFSIETLPHQEKPL